MGLKPSLMAPIIFTVIIVERAIILAYLSNKFLFWGSIGIIVMLLLAIFFLRSWIKLMAGIFMFAALLEAMTGILQVATFVLLGGKFIILLSGVTALLLGIAGGFLSVELGEEIYEADPLNRTDPEYAIVVDNVHKYYYVGTVTVHALRGISLKVKKGEFVAIMGPSGSGKSTLLNIIGALDRPTSGKVYIDGVDISQLDSDQLAELRNKKIGFVFQSYNLINRTTVLRNIEMPAIVAGIPKKLRAQKAKKLLEILGLDETALRRRPIHLSGGQQQRVAIARALMNNPTILLADEPTGNLDSKTGAEVMRYLRKLNRELGVTIVLVTHDRSVAEMADRILHIKDGVIVKEEILGGRSEEEAG